MTIHWIIGIGSPKRATMAEKSMLTAELSGTTSVPRPTISRGHTGDFTRMVGAEGGRCIDVLSISASIPDLGARPRVPQ